MENNIKQRYLIGILLLVFTASFCSNTQGVLLTDFIDSYGLHSSSQGLVSSFQSMGNIIALLLVMLYLSRLKKSTILLLFAIVVPLLFFTLGLHPPFFLFLLVYGLYGICFGLADSVSSSTIADLYPDNSASKMHLLQAAFGLGGLCGPIVLQLMLNNKIIWNEVLFITGGIALLVTFVFVITAMPMMKSKGQKHGKAEAITIVDIKEYFANRKKVFLIICTFLFGMHQIGILVWMPRFIGEYLGAQKSGAIALSLFWLGVTISRFILAKIRFDQLRVLAIGLIFSGMFMTFGILLGNASVMIAMCFFIGFCQGPALPASLSLSCKWASKTSLGSTVLFLSMYIGYVITPPTIGFLIQNIGAKIGLMFPATIGILAGVFATLIIPIINSENTQSVVK